MAYIIKVLLPQSNVTTGDVGLQTLTLHTCALMGGHEIQGSTHIDVVLYPQR
jgi:hypothetical protein